MLKYEPTFAAKNELHQIELNLIAADRAVDKENKQVRKYIFVERGLRTLGSKFKIKILFISLLLLPPNIVKKGKIEAIDIISAKPLKSNNKKEIINPLL